MQMQQRGSGSRAVRPDCDQQRRRGMDERNVQAQDTTALEEQLNLFSVRFSGGVLLEIWRHRSRSCCSYPPAEPPIEGRCPQVQLERVAGQETRFLRTHGHRELHADIGEEQLPICFTSSSERNNKTLASRGG
ncbi:uncharacterized protein LOC119379476 isoform X1 [Rhipicephalus sanguineus]|uniref:uncharacterized protein LOC119379476 isoform X1 n=1 Tax=Rhipicephalus sanguineus TaxID=34632 RepID=UPI0020C20096|nr:uncharacterized protein LOC119379476 isoform X1 [Rhipicephalus sanguineus]